MVIPEISSSTNPVDQDVEGFGDWVHLPHAIKDNVDSGDENLPDTVEREEVSQEVEVHSLMIVYRRMKMPGVNYLT